MKKIMIGLAVAGLAMASQAATYYWKSDTLKTITASAVTDNGSYGVGTVNTKNNTALQCLMEVYASGELIGTSEAVAIKYGTTGSKANNVTFNIKDAEQGETYDYVIKVFGSDNALTARGKDEAAGYDYSAAQIAAEFNGSVATLASGATTVNTGAPTAWNVSGITKLDPPGPGPDPTPEPTSGLLLVLGVAGLALRRKQ